MNRGVCSDLRASKMRTESEREREQGPRRGGARAHSLQIEYQTNRKQFHSFSSSVSFNTHRDRGAWAQSPPEPPRGAPDPSHSTPPVSPGPPCPPHGGRRVRPQARQGGPSDAALDGRALLPRPKRTVEPCRRARARRARRSKKRGGRGGKNRRASGGDQRKPHPAPTFFHLM